MMFQRDAAKEFLTPFEATLYESFQAAEKRLIRTKTDLPMDAPLWKPRSWASVMADYLYAEIEIRFALNPRTRVIHRNGYVALILDGCMVMRFKKFTKNRRARYTPTRAAREFFVLQEGMFDLPDSTNTVAGYISDDAGNPIGWYLTCPMGGGNLWSFELGNLGDDELAIPVPTTSPRSPIVRPKDGLQKPEEKSGV